MVKNEHYQSVVTNSGKTIEKGMGRGNIHVYKSISGILVFIETKDMLVNMVMGIQATQIN